MKKLFGMLIFSLMFCVTAHGAEHNELEMEYHALAHADDDNEIFCSVDWLSDEQLVTIGVDEVVKVWDVETSQCILETEKNERAKRLPKAIVTSPANHNLIACSYTTAIGYLTTAIRDMRTGETTIIFRGRNGLPVCWSPWGDNVVTTGPFKSSFINNINHDLLDPLNCSNTKAFWSTEGLVYTGAPAEVVTRLHSPKADPPRR